MAVFKCKMCGGTIEFEQGATVGICDSCGTKQTLPKIDDERRANLYDRANHFRRNNEFDKASGIYEQILEEDTEDAEAYWSLVLCRYGIEYVEDPKTHKRVPTVNRTQYTSIFDDDNYRSALQCADGYQRAVYEEEAAAINEIQKGILAISQKEEPFDVFICYKEADFLGSRTRDSVLANDLYHQLTQEGFKVFFSRITLEDKLGTAYEPYIFAALNSARVMVVLGTKPEYFNAAWVKNEWSRYLALIKNGANKTLIPAYRDMDPYDLPEEFSHLQAQDMSKLGFMQDLIRGIKKLLSDTAAPSKREASVRGNADLDRMLKNGETYVSLQNWDSAKEAYLAVTKEYPEAYEGWWGLIVAHTQNFEIYPSDSIAQLDEWFRYVSQLSDTTTLEKLNGLYYKYFAQKDVGEDLKRATCMLEKLFCEREKCERESNSLTLLQKAHQAEYAANLEKKENELKKACSQVESCENYVRILGVISLILLVTSVVVFVVQSPTAVFWGFFALGFLFLSLTFYNGKERAEYKDASIALQKTIAFLNEKGSRDLKTEHELAGCKRRITEIDEQIKSLESYKSLSEEKIISYFIAIESHNHNKYGDAIEIPKDVQYLRSKALDPGGDSEVGDQPYSDLLNAEFEVTCPNCGDTIQLTDEMLTEGNITCPNCGEILEFNFE